jgi:hypothetical protein
MRYSTYMSKKPPDLAGALAAMRAAPARGRGRRSSAYEWLHARHDALVAAFAERAPSWKALAEYLGANGITGADGRAPTATALRSAWLRVSADVARRRASQPTRKPLAASRQAVPPTGGGAAADPDAPPDFDQPIRAR